MEHAGCYPDYQLRLFKNKKGKFSEKHVHQVLKVDGETGYLKGHLMHENYETIPQFISKLNVYAQSEADKLLDEGYLFSFADAISFPLKEFLSRFFMRQGYKDGFHGLMVSLLMSFYHFVVFANLWEKEKFKEENSKETFNMAKKGLIQVNKETKYWIRSAEIENNSNSSTKFLLRLARKLSK